MTWKTSERCYPFSGVGNDEVEIVDFACFSAPFLSTWEFHLIEITLEDV